jgi:hypothetical protein
MMNTKTIEGTAYPCFIAGRCNVHTFLQSVDDLSIAEGRSYMKRLKILPALLGAQARSVWSEVTQNLAQANSEQSWMAHKKALIVGIAALNPLSSSFSQKLLSLNMFDHEKVSDFLRRFRTKLAEHLLTHFAGEQQRQPEYSFIANCLYNNIVNKLSESVRPLIAIRARSVDSPESLNSFYQTIAIAANASTVKPAVHNGGESDE